MTQARTPPKEVGLLLTILLLTPWLLPLNFVVLPTTARLIYFASLATGMLCFAVLGFVQRSRAAATVLIALAVSLSGGMLVGEDSGGTVLLFAQILTGFTLGRFSKYRLVAAGSFFAALVIVAAIEGLLQQQIYARLFPLQRFSLVTSGFRARGLVGQPLPNAVIGIALAFFFVALLKSIVGRRTRQLGYGAVTLGAGVLIAATGTRSAVVIAVVMLLVGALTSVYRRNAAAGLALLSLLAAAGLLFQSLGTLPSLAANARALNFAELRGSDSLTVRTEAFRVISELESTCGLCSVTGHGGGALQRELASGYAVAGLKTLDNQYVSLYWDYGIICLLVLGLGSAYLIVRAAAATATPGMRAAAACLTCLLLGSLFYETLTLSSGALLLGYLLGIYAWSVRDHGVGRKSHASTG